MKCICGLDHSEPLPNEFYYPPIVHFQVSGEDAMGCCHVCDGGWNISKGEKEWHDPSCPYIKTLELNKKKHRHMWE